MPSLKIEVRDVEAVRAACQRLGLSAPVHRKVTFPTCDFEGLAVDLPDWKYPVVFDTASGQMKADNGDGKWGDKQHLYRFLQIYGVEHVRAEAERRGCTVTEHQRVDGTIHLNIEEQGQAS